MNEIKTSFAQAEPKLDTAAEAKLVDYVGRQKVFNCVRKLREVVGIDNEANKAVEKVIL